jgi:polyhydroxyalkanoate synthesis regulator phasin
MTWLWIISLAIPVMIILIVLVKRRKGDASKFSGEVKNDGISVQLATLEERTKQLQGLEEKIRRIEDKQDSDSRELRDKLYNEYSKRLQDAVDLLKDTYGKMNTTTANAFREITNRNVEVYKQTATQLINMTEKLESAFKMLEEREHAQMREEMETLRLKINDLERDPLRVQLEELGNARTAQAVHEQSVKKITTLFWPNNGEVRFKEKIGQYLPDVYIVNHRLKIVADEVTTEDPNSIREKAKKVAEYMRGLNANVGYVIIPNAGVNPEDLREIKRTVSERGLYVVRITEYAVHLQVWYDVATTGVIDIGSLVEKGHNFLQVLEPIFDEFLAIVQNLEQRDEREFTYRQHRYKEIKFLPGKLLEAIERASQISDKAIQPKNGDRHG